MSFWPKLESDLKLVWKRFIVRLKADISYFWFMKFWVPFGYHTMAVYRFERKKIVINYIFYGVILMKYMGQHGTPMVPKILWCQSMISRLSNALSAVFIRLLTIFWHLHEIWLHIFNFSKNEGFYLET